MPTPTSSSEVSSVSGSSAFHVDALIGGAKWGGPQGTGVDLTYSFPGGQAIWSTALPTRGGYGRTSGGGEPWSDSYAPLNTTQQAAFRAAIATWAEVADIRFIEVADTATQCGDIRVAFTSAIQPGNSAHAYYPYETNGSGGDVWLSPRVAENVTPVLGNFGFMVYMHEIGHALGLKHPFDGTPTLPSGLDTTQYSIMAYEDQPSTGVHPAGPQLYDIAAIQYLYGPNLTTRTGNDTYRFSSTAEEIRVVWDAGGIDTVDASNQTCGAAIDLGAGAFSSIGVRNGGRAAVQNVAIAYGVVIENATGSGGDDTITGNAANNGVVAGDGNDAVLGLDGDDAMNGNTGNDTLNGNAGKDVVLGGRGDDMVYGGRGQDLVNGNIGNDAVNGNIGNDTIFGGQDNDTIFGGQDDDALYGDRGDDWLWGDRGNDTLTGGAGADRFAFAPLSGLDRIVDFDAAEGDRIAVAAGMGYTLSTDREGNAIIVFSDAHRVLVHGVAQVSADWFITV